MDNLPVYIMTVFLGDSLISIHSFTHSFVKVLFYYSRMLWALPLPLMEEESEEGGQEAVVRRALG